ncbi:MAG: hypothetical protein ACJ8FY_16360 [Gemmataceae bacterium]
MNVTDLIFLVVLSTILIALLASSKVARIVVYESLLHPFRRGQITINGNGILLEEQRPVETHGQENAKHAVGS